MPRPPKTIPTAYFNIGLPEDLANRLRLHLYSEVEGRIPHGALQAFFATLVQEYFHAQAISNPPSDVLPSSTQPEQQRLGAQP